MTAKQRIEEYLISNNIKTNRFYGKCLANDNGFLVIGDILSKDEGNLLLREDGDRLQLFTGKNNSFFVANKFYEFSIYIPAEQSKKELVVVIDLKFLPPIELNLNPYQEIVRLRYERLDNPEANKMIANLMREIGKGLYSSKQRMIFELLQNADDTPAGNDVSFHIDAHYDYLLIMHNGLPFNQDDVEAITSAAESTKRNDRKKTGYKGIGFKSVFTDSEEVLIKSGGFLFVFKRNHKAYDNFDSFYFSKKRYADYPKLLEEDKLKYTKQRKSFNGHTDIPWQLIPVWTEELPKSLENSRLSTYNNNVGFAIKFGREKVEEYLEAVANFANSPHFMLFLRNVNTFKSFKNAITIRKSGVNPVIIERIAQDENNLKLTYFKKEIDDIKVNDKALAEEGVIIYKRQRENEYGEISHYFSYDADGEKIIESIPPKLASFDETSITFAAPIINKMIRAEPDYLSGKSFSSFYTFLPMKEMRISLPFLVNADFVPSADRESLQGDNEWNEYILSKIAHNHLRWIKEIAEECIKTNTKQPEYLSLLLKKMLVEDFSIRMLIEKYNSTYKKSLYEVEFIINDKNKLCKTSEILIDTTGISNLLGSFFFYSISNTEKHLPNNNINSSYLLYEYLEIEKFNSTELIDILDNEENKELLSIVIKNLEKENYLNFLKWLDNFCKKNDTDADWITSLPFIRIDNKVLSLNEALEVTDFILKTRKTKGIESLLEKIGFKISEFYLDEDDYKHIHAAIYQQESYLKNDVKLFEHIATAKELNKLTAEEKNTLLTFLEQLHNVGPSKYAESLSFFNSKKINGSLKPLATLISNSCQNLPVWLTDFVIDEEEENSLNESFKNNLIKQQDLLEKVFCNPTTFNELINNINQSNIESFYTYILKLHKELPEDAEELDYSQISWFYMPQSNLFASPSTVYCPDSFTKLTITKYNNIKTVIESLSTDKLPIYASISLKRPFGLGCRNVNLITLLTGNESFEVIAVNDFLDWVQSEGEKDFFAQFLIVKEGEQYNITPSDGILQYHTGDQELIELLEASELKATLILLPNEVYSNERNKIGLLEGVELLKYLIEKGMAVPPFAKFIYQANEAELSIQYLSSLENLNIDSSKTYNSETDEFKIIKLAVQHLINNDDKKSAFRQKITIDGHSLLEKAISDDVYFYENKILLKIRLSDVIPSYKDRTFPLSEIIAQFLDFNDKQSLVSIFKSESRSPKKILKELNELNPDVYNSYQTFFLSFYESQYPDEDVLADKILFTTYQESNAELFNKEIKNFLDICLLEKYVEFTEHNIISDFTPLQYILDEEFAIESEKPPLWFTEWIGDEIDEDKKDFLESLGVNTTESSVVLLRKAILENDEAVIGRLRENLSDDLLLKNTLHWLSEQKKKGKIILKKEILEPFYKNLSIKNIPFSEILIPILEEYNSDNYSLIEYLEDNEYHLLNEEWGKYSESIFNKLRSNGKLITDDTLTKDYITTFSKKNNFIKDEFYEELDEKLLGTNSELFEEEYYENWEYYSRYPIYIYKSSKLPYIITYKDIEIQNITDNFADSIGGKYYIVESKKEFILSYLEGVMPENYLKSLKLAKADFDEKKKKEESEVRYTSEEDEALKRLFGDEIPPDFHKDLNLAALITGLVYLAKHGFNVTEAENNLKTSHQYAQLTPVYSSDNSEQWTVMGRSAKTGLLYLTAEAWERLDSDEIKLFVTSGNNDRNHHLFHCKDDVLQVSDTEFQVFRVAAQSSAANTDSILKGTFDKDKIWLIFKMKDNSSYNSIFEGGIRENEANPDFDNINTAEGSEY